MKTLTHLQDQLKEFQQLESNLEELYLLAEMAQEEDGSWAIAEYKKLANRVQKDLEKMKLEVLLSGPYDNNNAIISLHAGAGGTESQDWVEMLLRMYTRWIDSRGWKAEFMDFLPGDEAGVKSVTLLVHGINAYGYLKAEKGVHRLVRISPFDTSGRRHTSFASVDVLPEIDEEISVTIDSSDLKVDTYRASGAGGQHVNKTDSAVRLTHLPTGIVVQCQSERSQISNRDKAMKLLKAKLVALQQKEQEEEISALRGEHQDIAWGSQIRSYVFHPYSLVKDHRTNIEVGNVESVMNGEISAFITAYLQKLAKDRTFFSGER